VKSAIKFRDEVAQQQKGALRALEETQQSPILHHSITSASIIFPQSSHRSGKVH
jgi:hypothetical protein